MDSLDQKVNSAIAIVLREKENIFQTVLDHGIDDYGSPRDFMFFFEEDAKYDIKRLKLPKAHERYFLERICEIYGVYSDDQPHIKGPYYDIQLYQNQKKQPKVSYHKHKS